MVARFSSVVLPMLNFLRLFAMVQTEARMQRFFSGALISRENRKLGGHVVSSYNSLSFVSCAQACLSHRQCISTNFEEGVSSKGARCELNGAGVTSWADEQLLESAKGFVFSQYKHIRIETECEPGWCLNGGSCEFDETAGSIVCYCADRWKGARCEQKKKPKESLLYHFTNLKASGRKGPTSNAKYQGTLLDGQVQVSQGLQLWNVPATGRYYFEVCGASGGKGVYPGRKGGVGAKVTGEVFLRQGTALKILVGQQGHNTGGGGGGTYVALADDGKPLIIAGGGGGGDYVNGDPGQLSEYGSVNGGTAGGGGRVCISGMKAAMRGLGGGGGGGWSESGLCYEGKVCKNDVCQDGGKSFLSGGAGGRNPALHGDCVGGFGGGGTCGGGGGYSGGGVEYDKRSGNFHAGGGGSYAPDAQWLVTQDCKRGHGYVKFQIVI